MALEPCVEKELEIINPPADPKCACVPEPEDGDAGKVLTVGETCGPGAVIVPEQTVTITVDNVDPGVEVRWNAGIFTDGAAVIATVNDTQYDSVINNGSVDLDGEYISFYVDGEVLYFYNEDPGTYTVSLYVKECKAAYELQSPSSGYDLVFKVDSTEPLVSTATTISTLTIAEGSIAACVSMMENDRKVPKCAFRGIYGEDGTYFFTLDSDMSSFDIAYHAIFFKAHNGSAKYSITIDYDDTTFAINGVNVSSVW